MGYQVAAPELVGPALICSVLRLELDAIGVGMLQRLRPVLEQTGRELLFGTVEVDEMFIDGVEPIQAGGRPEEKIISARPGRGDTTEGVWSMADGNDRGCFNTDSQPFHHGPCRTRGRGNHRRMERVSGHRGVRVR